MSERAKAERAALGLLADMHAGNYAECVPLLADALIAYGKREPGAKIGTVGCPCCGVEIEIVQGDDAPDSIGAYAVDRTTEQECGIVYTRNPEYVCGLPAGHDEHHRATLGGYILRWAAK